MVIKATCDLKRIFPVPALWDTTSCCSRYFGYTAASCVALQSLLSRL